MGLSKLNVTMMEKKEKRFEFIVICLGSKMVYGGICKFDCISGH